MDVICKEPEQIGLGEPLSLRNGTVLKMVAQNTGDAVVPYHQGLIRSRINIPWTHFDLSPVLSLRGISYLILVDPYSKWPEVLL